MPASSAADQTADMMAAAMQPQQQQQQQHPPGGSILDVAREKDEGALRALCQVCSASGEVGEARKVRDVIGGRVLLCYPVSGVGDAWRESGRCECDEPMPIAVDPLLGPLTHSVHTGSFVAREANTLLRERRSRRSSYSTGVIRTRAMTISTIHAQVSSCLLFIPALVSTGIAPQI